MFLSSPDQPETFPSHRLLYTLTRAGLQATTQFRFLSLREQETAFFNVSVSDAEPTGSPATGLLWFTSFLCLSSLVKGTGPGAGEQWR